MLLPLSAFLMIKTLDSMIIHNVKCMASSPARTLKFSTNINRLFAIHGVTGSTVIKNEL